MSYEWFPKPDWMPQELYKKYEYDFKEWMQTTGFEPVEVLIDFDLGGSYEADRQAVFKMRNGSYAHVHESHCSCSGAEPDDVRGFYPTLDELIRGIPDIEWSSSAKELKLKLLEKKFEYSS